MSCLPESGGCEFWRVQPLVEQLNDVEGSAYEHVTCLDIRIRDTPQPEALYCDRCRGRMVIERKCLVWPAEYVVRHSSDHALIGALRAALPTAVLDGPYELAISGDRPTRRAEIEETVGQMARIVAEHWSVLEAGQGIEKRGQPNWSLRHLRESDLDEYAHETSVRFLLPLEMWQAPRPIPAELTAELERLLASAMKKFAAYSNDRQVVLLDPQGSVAHAGEAWWRALVASLARRPEAEIWVACEDFEDPDGAHYSWFERAWPEEKGALKMPNQPAGASG